MKFAGWIFAALLLSGGAPSRAAAQSAKPAHSQAFANCMDEFSTCDQTTLDPSRKASRP